MQIAEYHHTNPQYPDRLRQISAAPKQLFVLGELPTTPMVAIVGTRKPTEYGKQITYQLANELARAGMTIVSGLAHGIDGIAHQAALDAKGSTVAVVAHGLDQMYPAAHRTLAKKILASGGAIVSEYPIEMPPLKQNFPARNRIIAGLSLATIITEADASSGSLITANFALNQDRIVMAVPGPITSLRSAGPNNLIRTGAKAITSASDVLVDLDFRSLNLPKSAAKASSPQEAQVLELLNQGLSNSQSLIEASQLSAQEFAQVISLMEITGKVRNLGAGTWIAA